MSGAALATDQDLVDRLREFFRVYYRDEVGKLAEAYPGRDHLAIEWSDLHQFDQDVAEDYLDDPDRIGDYLSLAIEEYDVAVPYALEGVEIRVVGLHDTDVHQPIEIAKLDDPGYIGVQGDLAKVTEPKDELDEAAFECQRCGAFTYVPQTGGFQEPHQCSGCERDGPFEINFEESAFQKLSKIRIQTPPDERGDLQSQYIDGYVRGDLVWEGHDQFGIVARSGDKVTVYGTIGHEQRTKGKQKTRLFDTYLDVDAIEFDTDDDSVDIAAHRETFEDLASRPDAIDVFAESIAPELYATPAWDAALELLVAYLFGAPRIDIDQGPTYRGDIHALIMSDYGMGKSLVKEALAQFSPECIKESVTGMSSEVSLLAAAVEDDFGDGQWTLKPGILVRANGGHVILDEIDKTDADLARMNDALEGEQVVDVNKAGQSATYNSRVGLLALGNPKQSRFDPHLAISEQLGIDQSLLSRFDGIVTMADQPDEEMDRNVAETAGGAYMEAQEYQYGDREELDRLDREVPTDVGRAWVAYAREEVEPELPREQFERIKSWYAEDARQLNEQFGGDDEGGRMPVPVTPRTIDATNRFAVAFARAHLRETVTETDVDRAIALSKALVGQTFNGERFEPQETRARTQDARIRSIMGIVRSNQPDDSTAGVPIEDVLSEAEERNMDPDQVKHDIDGLRSEGELYTPRTGQVRVPK